MVAVVWSLLLSVVSVMGALYFLLWQTYVLRVEVILCAIQLAFIGLELVFGFISAITFARFVIDQCLHKHTKEGVLTMYILYYQIKLLVFCFQRDSILAV